MVGLSVLLDAGVGTVLPARTAQAGDATEQLPTAAGFQVEPVATAEELAHVRTLKPRKVVQDRRDGRVRYAYADPEVRGAWRKRDEASRRHGSRLARISLLTHPDTEGPGDDGEEPGL